MRRAIGLAGALTAVLAALAGCAGGDGTGDATYAWCEVYPPAFDSGFAAASFPDPLVGTVVGAIYRTTDGGVSWASRQGVRPAWFDACRCRTTTVCATRGARSPRSATQKTPSDATSIAFATFVTTTTSGQSASKPSSNRNDASRR
jgi:hypothetical protein